jgi:uncharacterized tellurite resistance protein B-like protein
VNEVRIDGSNQSDFAPPTIATRTAHRLRWCGKDEVLTAKSFLLRDPMVYCSAGAPSDDEPSCIDLSLEVRQSGRITEPAPSVYPTYAQLSPAQRAQYLEWLSKDRTSSIGHIGYAFLYLCGLERRIFLERADLDDVVKEALRLRTAYSSTRVFGLRLNQFLAFSLAGRGFEKANSHLLSMAFEKPPPHCNKNDLAVALAWFCEQQLPLPASWAMAIARQDTQVVDNPAIANQSDQLTPLFDARYSERFGSGLKLKPSSTDRQFSYEPINVSLQYRDESEAPLNWSIRIPDVIGYERQFTPLAALLASIIADRPPPSDISLPRSRRPPRAEALKKPATAQTGRGAGVPPANDSPARESAVSRPGLAERSKTPRRQEPAEKPPPIRWHGIGERVSVKSYLLNDPMVYVSIGNPAEDEASCIDVTLDVAKPVWESASALGFYPIYGKLTPAQRANYLSWLATGRTETLKDIGYAFLFFYGLERRLIVERQDLSPIVKECVRLLETYTFSSSFDGYLGRFLAFVLARSGLEKLKDTWFQAVFDNSRLSRDEDFLAVALAWLFRTNASLPVSWAMRIARMDPRSPKSIVFNRLPDEFNALFETRYREEFGDGLTLKVAKRERSIVYRPASPSLLFNPGPGSPLPEPIKIPNVLGIQSQFSPLVAIWSSCIEELKSASRALAKGLSAGTREAFERLPQGLQSRVEHPDKDKWTQLVTEHTGEDGFALVEISKLAAIHGLEERPKLTPTQSRALAQTARYVGFLIEPDSRLTCRPYSWTDMVSLLHYDDEPDHPSDSRFLAASLMLELGIFIAAADGTVDDSEVDQVAKFIESQFLLGPPEVRRLEAVKRVFMLRPPTLSGLGKRLQSALTHDQRQSVGRFLTGVAAANGIIDRKEISALKSAYRALDIGVDQLNSLLEESRRALEEPVEVDRGEESASRGEAIPPKPRPARPAGLVLDEHRLGLILAETQVVIETLGKAMLDPTLADEPQASRVLPANDPRFDALDARFHEMLAQLIGRQVWQRPEFNSLARSCNLMPSGALDAVNDWACELFDDPIVVEQGDRFEIQTHLLETL